MKCRGHDVQVVTYGPGDFYASFLEQGGVKHQFLGGKSAREWLPRIRRFLRSNRQDVVLAFLESSASYAEVASLPCRRWGLVVSERSSLPNTVSLAKTLRKGFHLLADIITTNSHTNRLILEKMAPMLKGHIVTIYNGVDLERFKPDDTSTRPGVIRFVVVARFDENKNGLRTIQAFDIARRNCKDVSIKIDWFGNTKGEPQLWRDAMSQIKQLQLQDSFHIYEPTKDIVSQYQLADAVILPSLFEGLPNTICEGMACGKAVLMSAVCDAGNLVKNGENGFLFSPLDPLDIASSISNYVSLTNEQRCAMGQKSRKIAEEMLDLKKIVDLYELVLYAAKSRRSLACCHWFPEVPQTALESVKQWKAN
jgi:glycosyltransferase involved in cell wall biosynthesis